MPLMNCNDVEYSPYADDILKRIIYNQILLKFFCKGPINNQTALA